MNEMRILIVGSIYLYFKMLELLLIHNIIGIISKDKYKFNSDFYYLTHLSKTYEVTNFITNDKNLLSGSTSGALAAEVFQVIKNN
tara:strand:+ start:564 stop:818 length:255 start_codon:yes stop_codon:yes gene_type:complete